MQTAKITFERDRWNHSDRVVQCNAVATYDAVAVNNRHTGETVKPGAHPIGLTRLREMHELQKYLVGQTYPKQKPWPCPRHCTTRVRHRTELQRRHRYGHEPLRRLDCPPQQPQNATRRRRYRRSRRGAASLNETSREWSHARRGCAQQKDGPNPFGSSVTESITPRYV